MAWCDFRTNEKGNYLETGSENLFNLHSSTNAISIFECLLCTQPCAPPGHLNYTSTLLTDSQGDRRFRDSPTVSVVVGNVQSAPESRVAWLLEVTEGSQNIAEKSLRLEEFRSQIWVRNRPPSSTSCDCRLFLILLLCAGLPGAS